MSDSSHPSVPESDPAPPVPDAVRPGASSSEEDLTHLPPEHRATVRRLRAQVDRATTALNRLQDENERLRRRVEELEERPAVQPDTTALVLDNDPEALRDRISSFIDAIDTYLENGTPASEEPRPSDDPSAE
jgi:uncharacterized coiled-coil protein SlyX